MVPWLVMSVWLGLSAVGSLIFPTPFLEVNPLSTAQFEEVQGRVNFIS